MRTPRSVLLLTALACPLAAHAQTLLRSVNGPAAGAQFGKACLVVPDQNSDGFKDVLVGAPGFNASRGAVYCISGAYLASGIGASMLWSVTPPTNPGDQFGYSLAEVGDITGDNVIDFVAGEPGFDGGGSDRGAVRLIHGGTHVVAPELFGPNNNGRMGTSVLAASDITGDGRREVAVTEPGQAGGGSRLYVFRSTALTSGGAANSSTAYANFGFGEHDQAMSLAGGFDFDGDGAEELVLGGPGFDPTGLPDAGWIAIVSVSATSAGFHIMPSTVAGERLGQSVSMGQDFDGDGAADLVVGAPNSPDVNGYQVGRALVISGRTLFMDSPSSVIRTYSYGVATPPANHADPNPNFHFGAAVLACPDLNGDGVGEVLVGAPDYFAQGLSGWNYRGLVRIFSGATGELLASLTGGATDRLGDAFGGAVNDLDGDGFKEFVLAGSLSDAGGVDSGVIRCYRLFPLAPVVYCVGKVNSLGCTPAIGFSGSASASSSAPFLVTASNLVNQKNGLLFYAYAPDAAVFQGGTKCAANPTVRTPSQNSGGATSGSSCTGAYSLDFNAWLHSGSDPALGAGAEVFAQYWSRDPQSPSHTSLSNALRFVVNP